VSPTPARREERYCRRQVFLLAFDGQTVKGTGNGAKITDCRHDRPIATRRAVISRELEIAEKRATTI
jgi:hypothetical protein